VHAADASFVDDMALNYLNWIVAVVNGQDFAMLDNKRKRKRSGAEGVDPRLSEVHETVDWLLSRPQCSCEVYYACLSKEMLLPTAGDDSDGLSLRLKQMFEAALMHYSESRKLWMLFLRKLLLEKHFQAASDVYRRAVKALPAQEQGSFVAEYQTLASY
jgi:hypothetical protein